MGLQGTPGSSANPPGLSLPCPHPHIPLVFQWPVESEKTLGLVCTEQSQRQCLKVPKSYRENPSVSPVQGQAEPERTLNRKVKISGCWASEGHRMSTVRATAVEVVITTVIYWALSICQVPSIELMFSPHNYGRDQIHLFFPLATQTPFPSLPCRWNNQVTGFQVWWNLHSF